MHERIRVHILTRWAAFVTTHPRITLIICSTLALLSVAFTIISLDFHTERSDLVSSDLSWNARYATYKNNFPRWDDVIIAVEGNVPNAVLQQLTLELNALPQIESADGGFDTRNWPLMFRMAESDATFTEAAEQFAILQSVAHAVHVNQALAVALQEFNQTDVEGQNDAMLQSLHVLLSPFIQTLQGNESAFSLPGWTRDDDSEQHWQPFTTRTGRIRLIFAQFADIEDGSASGNEHVLTATRETVARVLQPIAGKVPADDSIEWGVTGIPAIEADETIQSIRDSTKSSILAVVLIALMLILTFRGWTVPAIAVIALFIGVAWGFGWATLAIGHLQLLSVVFTIILLGLGIDFALHLVARMQVERSITTDQSVIITHAFLAVGPGMITGAITTAAAFVAIAFTNFQGAAEMGIIAAGGIVLCLIAVMSCVPALLVVFQALPSQTEARSGTVNRRISKVVATIILIVAALLTAGSVWLGIGVRYDPNILNLQPPSIESVEWEQRLIADDASSAWAAIVLTDAEHASEIANELQQLPTVATVDAAGRLAAANSAERLASISAMSSDTSLPPIPSGFDGLQLIMLQIEQAMLERSVGAAESSEVLLQQLQVALATSQSLDDATRQISWQHLNESFVQQKPTFNEFIDAALSPRAVRPSDLPAALRSQWIGADGSYLLRVNPAESDVSVLDPTRLEEFVRSVRSVSPDALGPPIQIYESSRLIQSAYIRAAAIALPLIFLLLLFDFRSFLDAVLAMLPVILGFIGTFGLMRIAGVPLNFANMIVMPIILGIGVDAGVHVVHRWRSEPTGQPPGMSGGTGRGITLTMLTTMIGFGCMMIAEHRGIRSLGFVMVAGLTVTLMACWTVLPAALRLRHRK